MCRHERIGRALLVLSGRSLLRPAPRCVHGARARLIGARATVQPTAGPGSVSAFRAFCVSAQTEEHGMKSLIAALAFVAAAVPAGAQSLAGLYDATVVVGAGQ